MKIIVYPNNDLNRAGLRLLGTKKMPNKEYFSIYWLNESIFETNSLSKEYVLKNTSWCNLREDIHELYQLLQVGLSLDQAYALLQEPMLFG